MPVVPTIDIDTLIERYDTLLFDAYGVLVHREGPLPGAVALLNHLSAVRKSFFVVTNSAARLPEQAAERYQGFGLAVRADQIISSGSLIANCIHDLRLVGARCAVLGPKDSGTYVARGGGRPVSPFEDFDALLIGDQVGFPFLEAMDAVISRLIQKFDQGLSIPLILPNPDLIYPKSEGFGLTAGAMATMIERILDARYPGRNDTQFVILGKPETPIFEAAAKRAGSMNLIMIGDQLGTDILGAHRFGIDSALILGGVSTQEDLPSDRQVQPTYRLESLFPTRTRHAHLGIRPAL